LDYEQALSPLEYRSDAALPPNVRDFVPKDHVSRFIVGLVRESLDLKAIMGSYGSGLGQPPFDPRMMVSLLLHGYASGLYSSRRIARACCERNDFVMIVALDPPDFRTISDFRKRHLKGARRFVPTGTEVVRDSGAGQTWSRRIGWHEDQSECVET
jgi:transposase